MFSAVAELLLLAVTPFVCENRVLNPIRLQVENLGYEKTG